MSLNRLKALMAATALLTALTACEAGAEVAGGPASAAADGAAEIRSGASQDALPALADDPAFPERLALARELYELSTPPDFSEQLIESLIISTITTINMNHEELSEAELAEAESITRERFGAVEDRIIRSIASAYADLFLKEELEELIAFHRTETGAKFRALSAEVDDSVRRTLADIIFDMEVIVVSEIRPQQPASEMVTDLDAASEASDTENEDSDG